MSDKIFIIPAEGILIRNPLNQIHIKSEGEFVPNSTFWRRRINDGSVTLGSKGVVKTSVEKPVEKKDENKKTSKKNN